MTDSSNQWPDNPFWDYSLAIYGKNGLADAFLELQEAISADVNILLYCCWVGAVGGGEISADEIKEITDGVVGWQSDVVKPLRTVRNVIKTQPAKLAETLPDKLYTRIQNCELEAERVEQLMLFSAHPVIGMDDRSDSSKIQDVQRNLECYATFLGTSLSQNDKKNIAVIAQGSI